MSNDYFEFNDISGHGLPSFILTGQGNGANFGILTINAQSYNCS